MNNKEKEGIEGIKHDSMQSIKAKFRAELDQELGLTPTAHAQTKGKKEAVPNEPQGISLTDASDPTFIAKQHGFKCGDLYTLKESNNISKLTDLNAFGATFEAQVLYPTEDAEIKLSFEHLKHAAALFKGRLPTQIPDECIAHCATKSNPTIARDVHRAAVFQELMGMAERSTDGKVNFIVPAEVHANCDCKPGAMKLFPFTDLQRVTQKSSSSRVVVCGNGCSGISLDPPPKCTKIEQIEDQMKNGKAYVIAAFWWCKESTDDVACNMKLTSIKTQSGYTIPILENSKALRKHDVLIYCSQDKSTAKKPRHFRT